METLLRELRYGLRILTKTPGFAAIAVLTLALSASAHPRQFSRLWTPFYYARFLIRIRKKSCACGNRRLTVTE